MLSSALPLFARATLHGDRTALIDAGCTYSYQVLLDASARVAIGLLAGATDLGEDRVAFLVPRGADYVATQWGIWRAGGVAVPLAISHPPAELEYTIGDADAGVVVAAPELAGRVRSIAAARGARFLTTSDLLSAHVRPGRLPHLEPDRRAMILKTGGYKVSALEIEEVLRTHQGVAVCAVVGVEDEDWGERVCVAVVPRPGGRLEVAELRGWARERLAPYKVPRQVIVVRELPRNAMGKVTKTEVKQLFRGAQPIASWRDREATLKRYRLGDGEVASSEESSLPY